LALFLSFSLTRYRKRGSRRSSATTSQKPACRSSIPPHARDQGDVRWGR
jgi:hypothetical protein